MSKESALKELKKLANKIHDAFNIRKFKSEHGEPIEDWAYLIHHIEIIDGEEELHHCLMLDHLGNKYETGHITDNEGKLQHCILGLAEDQKVYWSDQEAIDDGYTIPCPDRQLE